MIALQAPGHYEHIPTSVFAVHRSRQILTCNLCLTVFAVYSRVRLLTRLRLAAGWPEGLWQNHVHQVRFLCP